MKPDRYDVSRFAKRCPRCDGIIRVAFDVVRDAGAEPEMLGYGTNYRETCECGMCGKGTA